MGQIWHTRMTSMARWTPPSMPMALLYTPRFFAHSLMVRSAIRKGAMASGEPLPGTSRTSLSVTRHPFNDRVLVGS